MNSWMDKLYLDDTLQVKFFELTSSGIKVKDQSKMNWTKDIFDDI